MLFTLGYLYEAKTVSPFYRHDEEAALLRHWTANPMGSAVVVITHPSHGWGRRFDPGRKQGFFLVWRSYFRVVELFLSLPSLSIPWLIGLGEWFSLRVREVLGSNPGRAHQFLLLMRIKNYRWRLIMGGLICRKNCKLCKQGTHYFCDTGTWQLALVCSKVSWCNG